MKRRNRVLIWVDPAFKKKIKSEAVDEDLSILEFTRRLATPQDKDTDHGKRINRFWERII